MSFEISLKKRQIEYSKTSEERTLWDCGLCPLFGGCPLLGGCPFFYFKPSSVSIWDIFGGLYATGCLYCDDLYKQVLHIRAIILYVWEITGKSIEAAQATTRIQYAHFILCNDAYVHILFEQAKYAESIAKCVARPEVLCKIAHAERYGSDSAM